MRRPIQVDRCSPCCGDWGRGDDAGMMGDGFLHVGDKKSPPERDFAVSGGDGACKQSGKLFPLVWDGAIIGQPGTVKISVVVIVYFQELTWVVLTFIQVYL